MFVGDYIDRGPDSAGVLEWLWENAFTSGLGPAPVGFFAKKALKPNVVLLSGNHERHLRNWLADPEGYLSGPPGGDKVEGESEAEGSAEEALKAYRATGDKPGRDPAASGAASSEFRLNTAPQLEKAGWGPYHGKLGAFVSVLRPYFAYRFLSGAPGAESPHVPGAPPVNPYEPCVLVTHGGLPTPRHLDLYTEMGPFPPPLPSFGLGLVSARDLEHGVGAHNEDIDKIFTKGVLRAEQEDYERNASWRSERAKSGRFPIVEADLKGIATIPTPWFQIHGHRNASLGHPIHAAPRSFNLEGGVEVVDGHDDSGDNGGKEGSGALRVLTHQPLCSTRAVEIAPAFAFATKHLPSKEEHERFSLFPSGDNFGLFKGAFQGDYIRLD